MQLHHQTVSTAGGVTGVTETLTAPPRRPAEGKTATAAKAGYPTPRVLDRIHSKQERIRESPARGSSGQITATGRQLLGNVLRGLQHLDVRAPWLLPLRPAPSQPLLDNSP